MARGTYLFFIDETGNYSKDDFLLRGGFLVNALDYLEFYKVVLQLKAEKNFLYNQEIKWHDLSTALHLKKKNKPFKTNKTWRYLKKFSTDDIEGYIKKLFSLIAEQDIKVITTISLGEKNRETNSNLDEEKLLKFQLQNLMQRAQYTFQEDNSCGIIIYDTINKNKDKFLRSAYQEIRSIDNFVKDYSNIIDSLFCEISNFNIGIQIADFIIGCIAGCLRGYEFSTELYKDYIYSKLRRHNNRILGRGLMPIPNQDTTLHQIIKEKLLYETTPHCQDT
jgi:hypothetical protein